MFRISLMHNFTCKSGIESRDSDLKAEPVPGEHARLRAEDDFPLLCTSRVVSRSFLSTTTVQTQSYHT